MSTLQTSSQTLRLIGLYLAENSSNSERKISILLNAFVLGDVLFMVVISAVCAWDESNDPAHRFYALFGLISMVVLVQPYLIFTTIKPQIASLIAQIRVLVGERKSFWNILCENRRRHLHCLQASPMILPASTRKLASSSGSSATGPSASTYVCTALCSLGRQSSMWLEIIVAAALIRASGTVLSTRILHSTAKPSPDISSCISTSRLWYTPRWLRCSGAYYCTSFHQFTFPHSATTSVESSTILMH